MDWISKLNLNSFKIWKNHRRIITFGGFLTIFCWWFNPIIQEAKYKNNCIRTLSKAIVVKTDINNYSDFLNKSKINKEDLAKATAYMDCSNGKTYF